MHFSVWERMCVCECRMCRPAKSDKIKCREIKFRAPTKAKRDKSKVFAQLRPLCISGHHGEFLSLPLSCEQDMQGEVSCALCLGHRKSLFQKIENAKFHLCNVRHHFTMKPPLAKCTGPGPPTPSSSSSFCYSCCSSFCSCSSSSCVWRGCCFG